MSSEVVKKLIDARSAAYGVAFETRSAEDIASWFSEEIEFNDIALDEYKMDKKAAEQFFSQSCEITENMKILEQSYRGTPEFVTWEMFVSVTFKVDMPDLGIKKGQQAFVRGVAVQWWRWEGEGAKWEGDLSHTSRGIRGWKIVKENDYMVTLKENAKGLKITV
ncbi:hypothetical protein FDECE_2623 [Fusarium decemcellulare]|nr:hypothetical protein FDECE_2623 [Fusarium decemcellulare]